MQELCKKFLYYVKKPIPVFFFILLLSFIVVAKEYTQDYNDPVTFSIGDLRWCLRYGACTFNTLTVYNLSVIGDVFNVTMNLVTWNITENFNVGGNLQAKNITADNYFYSDGTSINDTLTGSYVPYIGAIDDVDLGDNDLYARDGNFSGDVKIDDDLYARDGYFDRDVDIAFDLEVTDDTVLLDTLKVYGISTFYNDFRVYDDATFNDSITLKRTSGDAILEVETEDTAGSSQIRVLADGTNDLYIYTYGSTAPLTYYGFPRAESSYVDAQGKRLIIGTFDTAPLYLATSQDPRVLITGTGDVLPFDDDDYMLGNATNRWEDFYVVGEESQGIHFVQDDYSYGNLSMDDDFNLLWNGQIINATAIGTSWNGSVNYYTRTEVDTYISNNITSLNESVKLWVYNGTLQPAGNYLTNLTDANFTNLWVTGNFTGNQIYGGMYYHNHTGKTLSFDIANYNYTLYMLEADYLNGFTVNNLGVDQNSSLTAQVGGVYQAIYAATGDGENNDVYRTAVTVNDVPIESCDSHKKLTAGGDILTMNGNCFITLNVDDNVSVKITNEGGTGSGTYYGGNLNLVRVGS